MKAVVVTEKGQPPVYGDFRDPVAAVGKALIRVRASALSHLTRGRASGAHYSAVDAVPFVAGADGTGLLENGKRAYFLLPERPFGAMAEMTLVDDRHWIALPDAISDEKAAAMAIPGMSSWAALRERAVLRAGETVLVNGATGSSGRLAIQIAKHLGAGRVVATARNPAVFEDLHRLGADAAFALLPDKEATTRSAREHFERGVDVVLDYLWGSSAEALISAAEAGREGVPIRFVQIGSISGEAISLAASALRSSGLQVMGSGLGSVPSGRLLEAIEGVFQAAPKAGFTIETQSIPLADAARAWSNTGSGPRMVLVP